MADYSHEAILGIKLVTIKGRTYRKAPVTSGPGIKKETETGPKNRKLRERKGLAQIQYACSLEEPCDTMLDYDDAALALDIAEEGGLFTHQMHVPSVFFGNIIGKGGQMVSRLQRETGATIQVPKRGGEHITIKANKQSSIMSARTRIEVILQQAKDRMAYTHFLSIPLASVKDQVKQWQDEVVDTYTQGNITITGFDPSILLAPERMHLTVLMLKLFSPQEIEKAKELLNKASPQLYDLLGSRSAVVRLQGLEIMNDDPGAVDVLYVKVNEVGDKRLIPVCDYLLKLFFEAGLTSSQDRGIKLHATLINTRHRRASGEPGQREARRTFDATELLQKYGNVDFGQHRLNGIHLSERGHFSKETGYYHCVSSLSFP